MTQQQGSHINKQVGDAFASVFGAGKLPPFEYDSANPCFASIPEIWNVKKIEAGDDLACYVDESGALFICERVTKYKWQHVENLSNMVDVSCGRAFALALNAKGQVYLHAYGTFVPTFDALVSRGWRLHMEDVLQICAGGRYYMILGKNKKLYSSMYDSSPHDAPAEYSFFNDKPSIVQIACGTTNSCVLLENGSVYVIDSSRYSELLLPLKNVTRISCGTSHLLFVNDKYQCFGYGSNESGELGLGTTVKEVSEPKLLTFPHFVTGFCAVGNSSMVLSKNCIHVCGYNRYDI